MKQIPSHPIPSHPIRSIQPASRSIPTIHDIDQSTTRPGRVKWSPSSKIQRSRPLLGVDHTDHTKKHHDRCSYFSHPKPRLRPQRSLPTQWISGPNCRSGPPSSPLRSTEQRCYPCPGAGPDSSIQVPQKRSSNKRKDRHKHPLQASSACLLSRHWLRKTGRE